MAVSGMRDAIPIRYMTQNPASEDGPCIQIRSLTESWCNRVLWRDSLMSEATKSENITPFGANISCSSACHSWVARRRKSFAIACIECYFLSTVLLC